ncbi:hypothetical protein MGG_13857 [Pyricularia oryzae 70-15]|uniref:Uncharacterized protein n=2 Tax=Pyricularia oryzae TaxID=318829 RepID=G4N1G5_PYRO7|nr:uncharacterized protein MGG_13857 [Pyricularia oryzae 70-15]EHA53232.1 hypothetical protein MGG_13857 [Pyricularia oryzae 70-15]KAI7909369.1 hypothetical protein M9X92_011672 [Pyricularia oryzae]QBZ66570.1 hypothetical protein PoMZ_13552 [Pyricularia oryzae]
MGVYSRYAFKDLKRWNAAGQSREGAREAHRACLQKTGWFKAPGRHSPATALAIKLSSLRNSDNRKTIGHCNGLPITCGWTCGLYHVLAMNLWLVADYSDWCG